ncbi:hypothetical protein DSECCO2_498970 [anaerobic digester metagenome]
MAAIDTEPIRKRAEVTGMLFTSPPNASIFLVPVAWTTEPAQRKSRLLKTAWLKAWKQAPTRLKRARDSSPSTLNTAYSPIPVKIIPMFSMLL